MSAANNPPEAATGTGRPRRRWYRSALRVLGTVLGAYLVVLLLMWMLENKLIYFPAKYPAGNWQPAGMELEDAWFEAADGTKLHGWYVPHDAPRAVVLFAHGNAGNLSGRADIVRELHERFDVSIMIFDYRGYGRSEGSPSERGVLLDARAARSWLADRAGIAENEIVLLGRSIGGAVMVDLAADGGARGLVLESTFTSLPDVAAHHYPWAPVRTFMRNRFNSLDKIGGYQGPLLQSHGNRDEIVPLSLGRRLFEAAGEPKSFVLVEGADHNTWFGSFPAYSRAFDEFLDALP